MNNIESIIINYGGRGFAGKLWIHPLEFFPVPVTHMKRLMKICQMGSCCEERYLIQFMASLKTLQEHSAFFSHRKAKMLQDDIKIIQERLDRIGGKYKHEH